MVFKTGLVISLLASVGVLFVVSTVAGWPSLSNEMAHVHGHDDHEWHDVDDADDLNTDRCHPVKLSTFQRWSLGSVIGYKVQGDNVVQVYCKLCAKHSDKILSSSSLKGKARLSAEKYISGSKFVSKHTVHRHKWKSSPVGSGI